MSLSLPSLSLLSFVPLSSDPFAVGLLAGGGGGGGAGQHVALKLASHLPFSPRSVQPQCTHFPHPLHFTDH